MNKLIATLLVAFTGLSVIGQGFNVSFEGQDPPETSFGAAAGQPGFWNPGFYGAIRGLDGRRLPLSVKQRMVDGGGTGWFNNPSNTGNYAKLLNDAMDVGTLVQGGLYHLTIDGLQPGNYKVYTYAVVTSGQVSYAPVYIPQAAFNQVQVVTGPMPGNAFEYLVTHSIHDVRLDGGSLELILYRAPFAPRISLNGVQVVKLADDRAQEGRPSRSWLLPRP